MSSSGNNIAGMKSLNKRSSVVIRAAGGAIRNIHTIASFWFDASTDNAARMYQVNIKLSDDSSNRDDDYGNDCQTISKRLKGRIKTGLLHFSLPENQRLPEK